MFLLIITPFWHLVEFHGVFVSTANCGPFAKPFAAPFAQKKCQKSCFCGVHISDQKTYLVLVLTIFLKYFSLNSMNKNYVLYAFSFSWLRRNEQRELHLFQQRGCHPGWRLPSNNMPLWQRHMSGKLISLVFYCF